MTPPISEELMASRPLYDPDPETFVARAAVRCKKLRRVRLSDFAVVALAVNIKNRRVTKKKVDIFENVYVRGAKPRRARKSEGKPALAPDGTVMSMRGKAYPGSSGEPAGPWNLDNVSECEGYEEWLARVTQREDGLIGLGFDKTSRINEPMPPEDELRKANAYVAKAASKKEKMNRRTRKTRLKKKSDKKRTPGNPNKNVVKKALEKIDDAEEAVERSAGHPEVCVQDRMSQRSPFHDMTARFNEVLPSLTGTLVKRKAKLAEGEDDSSPVASGWCGIWQML